jgi:DNA-binding response OmpR family regulator
MTKPDETLVLVADDEPSTLALVSARLRARGYRVLEASDGDQAWELAYENLPSLVLLDVMMPGMSGWEVCRKIREAVSLAHTGIIMLTGIGETLNETTSPLFGADAYIDKPFEFTDLDQKIRETLVARQTGTFGRPDHADEEDADVVTSVSYDDSESAEPLNGAAGPARPEKPAKAKKKGSAKRAKAKPAAKPTKKAKAKKAAQKAPAKKAPAKKASKRKA